MAKAPSYKDTAAVCKRLIDDAKMGVFVPVYLLMGEEPYYPDLVCDAIMAHALDDSERDFNQTVYYGSDSLAEDVASAARSYPMMAERRLVVLKEAQSMKSYDALAQYCAEPMDTTVLVILMRGQSADKRQSLYKNIKAHGVVLESAVLRDYELNTWIIDYFSSRGLKIAPDAAALLSEYAGSVLGKIAVETDKLLKNLPEGSTAVSVSDIESNVGISKEWSVFELTKELSYRNSAKALKIASRIAQTPKFFLPMAISAIYTHFLKVLRYEALLMQNPRPSSDEKVKALSVSPFFFREYDAAVSNYPAMKCIAIMGLLQEFDYRAKGGGGVQVDDGALLTELVAKILNI